ncbi:enoyl-CoA hydratase [Glutamicibacter uratoxydans]|uniref:Enoyl-CoA hydratase n=1 Tax=Glutamicibacter uratoxydans TaxID=43667 RepID=A0A4Y4DML3_GLUUR|nr:enoyl-CoA hydratase/isomerase family protein [Glutamicibacter uratoxydans]GED04885.1 enoyl-CoA hydratase [Glutamicibacter uratoxydans]
MSTKPTPNIEVHRRSGTATVLLQNPAQRNALTKEMCLQLVGALAGLSADPDVDVVVLRGDGANFSAGIAIDQMEQVLFDRDQDGDLVNHLDLLDRTLRECAKPTIAAVQGLCFGGAWQVAAACDIQLASNDVAVAITPAKIGLVFPRAGIERLVQRVGEDRAKYLLLTGAKITAAQADAWGLFTTVVHAEEFEDQLAALIAQLQANSPYALLRMKEALSLAAQGIDHPGHDQWWATLWEENAANPDLVEGRAAFLERRPARFGESTGEK